MSTTNPYAPPRGAVRDFAADDLALAGRGARLAAAILDGLIALVMIYLPALVFMVATDLDDSAQLGGTAFATMALLCLIGFVGWAWITALLVARNGQTIAKRLLEIKVVRSDGTPASLGRIFWLRNCVNWLLGLIPFYAIIDALFIFGVRRQCIHDLIADTIVVKA